jgi:hypothetical protein
MEVTTVVEFAEQEFTVRSRVIAGVVVACSRLAGTRKRKMARKEKYRMLFEHTSTVCEIG